MDATAAVAPQPIIRTPLIQIMDQPADLSQDQGRLWLVEQGCWDAQQNANGGDPDHARALMSSKVIPQANSIYDMATRGTALSYVSVVLDYINALAPQASSLLVQQGISDQTYMDSQVLTAAQLTAERNDNIDTAAARAGNLGPTAYGLRVPDVERAANAEIDKVAAAGAGVASNFKWYILGAAGFILAMVAILAYASRGKSVSVST